MIEPGNHQRVHPRMGVMDGASTNGPRMVPGLDPADAVNAALAAVRLAGSDVDEDAIERARKVATGQVTGDEAVAEILAAHRERVQSRTQGRDYGRRSG